jgi:hypothetical protein
MSSGILLLLKRAEWISGVLLNISPRNPELSKLLSPDELMGGLRMAAQRIGRVPDLEEVKSISIENVGRDHVAEVPWLIASQGNAFPGRFNELASNCGLHACLAVDDDHREIFKHMAKF